MIRGLLRGDHKVVASWVVSHRRATRSGMGRSPRVSIRTPTRLMSWKETGLSWGDEKEVTGLQTCIQSLVNKQLKLVNIVQVMLVRRILPCQQRDFNLWESDPAQHQTLSKLFDTTHKDVWKVLFKGAEAPPPLTEDCGLSAKRPANLVSLLYLIKCFFPPYNHAWDLSLHAI